MERAANARPEGFFNGRDDELARKKIGLVVLHHESQGLGGSDNQRRSWWFDF